MPAPLRPLNPGNAVTASVSLMRSHLSQFVGLTCKAYLWLLVPIYGWAKFMMLSGVISRIAFQDMISQPESPKQGQNQLSPKLWDFLLTAFLVGLISGGAMLAFYVVLAVAIVLLVLIVIGTGLQETNSNLAIGLGVILVLVLIGLFIIVLTWIYARLMLSELPLVAGESANAIDSIGQSWQLTKGHVWRVQLVVLVAFLITLPLQIISQFGGLILQAFLARFLSEESAEYLILSFAGALLIGVLSALLIVPFWQCLKAVVYYDLRNRSEGLGLNLKMR